MTTSIRTARPSFGHLTGEQPVGHTQIAVAGDYAGTVTLVTRVNARYWSVIVRDQRGAFRDIDHRTELTAGRIGMAAKIWHNGQEYVVDYWNTAVTNQPIEAGTAHSLRAAIGIAIDSAASRGHEKGLW